jgi:hypothetical protein
MMVAVASRIGHLVTRGARAEIQSRYEIELLQLLEHAVDGSATDLAVLLPEKILDLQSRERAFLLREQLDNRPPGATAPIPRLREATPRILGPVRRHLRT